jgi:hypothetical protein
MSPSTYDAVREVVGVARLPGRLRPTQVNLVLLVLLVGVSVTGPLSWVVEDRWSAWLVRVHGVLGLSLLLLAGAKLRGPVRAGFKRHRWTRWVSAVFGILVLAAVALGVVHATGLWYGIGTWSPLWTHSLVGVLVVGLLVWHLTTRPVRARVVDLDRQALLRTAVVLGAAAAIYVAQETLTRSIGLPGGRRRVTGSHEVATNRPQAMPQVIWLDDQIPTDTAAETWSLVIGGTGVTIAGLRDRARPVVAVLDCTGGWWSEQAWDAVPLSELFPRVSGRSVEVRSATGYTRLFAADDLDRIHLAVGYGGAPLRPGHGGPVRLSCRASADPGGSSGWPPSSPTAAHPGYSHRSH